MTESKSPIKPPGVILAGGRATRLGGGDKCLLAVAGKPILRWQIERMTPQVSTLALNANGPAQRFASFGINVLPDCREGYLGPLAGALTALDWAESLGADCVQLLSGDTPFPPLMLTATLAAVAEEANEPDIVAPRVGDDTHVLCGLWLVRQKTALVTALSEGLRAVRDWTARRRVATAAFSASPYDPFFNVNRPEDVVEGDIIARLIQ